MPSFWHHHEPSENMEMYFNVIIMQGDVYYKFQVPCASRKDNLCMLEYISSLGYCNPVLPCVSRSHLAHQSLVLYLYRPRAQCHTTHTLYAILHMQQQHRPWRVDERKWCSRANRKWSTYRRTTELEQVQLPDCAEGMGQFGAENLVQAGNQHQIWQCIRFALHSHIPFLSSELLP